MYPLCRLYCRRTVVPADGAVEQNEVLGGRSDQRQLRHARELSGRQRQLVLEQSDGMRLN